MNAIGDGTNGLTFKSLGSDLSSSAVGSIRSIRTISDIYKDFYFSDQSGRVYCSPPSIYCGQINGQWCRRRRHLRKRLKIKVFHMGSDCVRLRERCSNRFLHLPFEKVDKTRNFAREMNNPNFTNLDCSSLPITNSIFN